jgi:hypothetical protein
VASPAAAKLGATCQVTSDGSPASQQDYDPGDLGYAVSVINGTSSAVTITGYVVTFTAYGQVIDTENPGINPALAEPGDTWNYSGSYVNAPQVTEQTYLDESCSITQVETTGGPLTPNSVSDPNGNSNTHQQDIASAQTKLSNDVGTLNQDAQTLDSDNSLAGDLNSMHSDYGTEQSDYGTEQSDGCPGASGDASAVGGDASAIGGDMSALQGDEESLKNSKSGVQSDISTVQGGAAAITQLGATPATDDGAAIAAGEKALKDTASAISYATRQGGGYLSEANSLSKTAEQWAASRGCP